MGKQLHVLRAVCDHSQVLVILTQRRNYLFVCPKQPTLHSLFVRRIWETPNLDESNDGEVRGYWSDNTPDNEYVHQPDLQWYRDDDFKMENDRGHEEEVLDFEDHSPTRHWLFGPLAYCLHKDNGVDAMNALSYLQLILRHIKEEDNG